MQYKTITMNDQYRALETLVHVLQLKYESDEAANGAATTNTVCENKIRQRLMWASFNSSRLYDRLSSEEVEDLVPGVVKAINVLISCMQHIQIVVNAETVQMRILKTPKEVIECDPNHFRALLEQQGSRLSSRFGPTILSTIWTERNKLISRYEEDSAFRRRVEGITNLPFGEAWTQLDGKVASSRLLSFIAGLAARTQGTHTVEGDFSSLKQAKSSHQACLSNYAMEGQLQAKQHFELLALARKIQN